MTKPNVAHLNVHTAEFTPLADIEGEEAILYRSEDGTRIAGSFRESGTHTLVQDFDEFIYVSLAPRVPRWREGLCSTSPPVTAATYARVRG